MGADVVTWRFSLPSIKNEGWAIVFMDSVGCFSVLSDYGDCSYVWPVSGFRPGQDFRQFILECDDDYLLRKLGMNRKEYDGKGTFQAVKAQILSERRDRRLTKTEALDEWQHLRDYNSFHSEYDFVQWSGDTSVTTEELVQTKYVSEVLAVVRHVLPRLRVLLQESLKQPSLEGGSTS